MFPINNFTMCESVYGKFIVNRHNIFQIEHLSKTGKTHMEDELQSIFTIVDVLPEDSVIIDGGANIGFVTIPIAQRVKHKNIKIISFEPQRMLFYALSGSVALNDLTNVYPINMALGEEICNVSLPNINYNGQIKNGDYGQVQVSNENVIEENPFMANVTVKCVTIDSLNLDKLDFIKLDIEGFEIQALKGASNSINKFRPFLWVEYWQVGTQAIVDLINSLVSEYYFFKMSEINMVCVPKEKLHLVATPNSD